MTKKIIGSILFLILLNNCGFSPIYSGDIKKILISKSEIVVPVFKNKIVIGVLDVDSDQLNSFDEIDQQYLEKIVSLIQD